MNHANELLDWFSGPSPISGMDRVSVDTILRALRLLAAAEANDGSTPETDAAFEDAFPSTNETCQRLERERRGLAARVAELEAALDRYGCHADSCGDMDAMNGAEIKSCNCGLDAARSK